MTTSAVDSIWNLVADTASRYSSDTIVILGKGPSADAVHSRVFRNAVVIGINDAERIHPADITLFHEDWVPDSLQDDGFRAQAYVTSQDVEIPGRTVIRLPFYPIANDAEDEMLLRFQDRHEIALEEVKFLTALEIARMFADHRGRTQTVYMVGFDFTPDSGSARAATTEYAPKLTTGRRAGVELQEYVLRNALYALEGTNVEVHHVGAQSYSSVSTEELNSRYRVSVQEKDDDAAAELDLPTVEVTAEITTNHFGDRDRLETLVRAAHDAGADWVKVQKREVDTFYTPEQLAKPYRSPFGTTFGDYRRQLELSRDDFRFLDELCRDLGIGWFASVLDRPSFEFMMELDVPLIKLPSTISEKRDYLEFVAENYTGSLVLSTGMTDQSYERWVLDTFQQVEKLYLLHCNSAYPTPDEHTNIGVVRHYAQLAEEHPHIVPGYSSHDFGWMASALAVAAGAQMVEKHVKLGNTEWAHFDAVAVDLMTDEFKEYVDAVRRAQLHVGSTEKRVTPSEHHKY
ncbi:N-acetylneuraminate synthase family protein [Nesterenkonia alba]|uniref:N-acetylneuraminate synthase family protein n=1 Tax=Nesterenkonia alba TaxID=515814 RepID=UPI0003B70A9D|nr:N-acetylneuraminate synthase family protein [Nesterenkonia alba]